LLPSFANCFFAVGWDVPPPLWFCTFNWLAMILRQAQDERVEADGVGCDKAGGVGCDKADDMPWSRHVGMGWLWSLWL